MPIDPNFGAPTEIALVRSPSGFPATLLDGIMVRRHPPTAPDNDGWVRIPDTGLTPGTWYYYGLFAKYVSEGNTHWLRIGERSVLLPQEYLSADHLWERIPEWYRRQDMEPGGLHGVLRRLIDIVGYQTDAHRTWAYTVGDVWDAEKISADLLPFLGDTLGQPVEYAAGDERYRSLLSNILPLRKMKGTEHGTEAYLSSLTGYRTRVYSGLNLLPTIDEAEAKYSNGLWAVRGNSTLTRVVSTGAATPGPAAGATYHRLTYNTAAVTTAVDAARRRGTDLTRMIPVEAGHQIVTSAFFRSSFTGTLVVRYRWYGANGAVIGSDTVATIGAIGTDWVRRNAADRHRAGGSGLRRARNPAVGGHEPSTGSSSRRPRSSFADLAWRPEDAPGSANTPPLSWAGIHRRVLRRRVLRAAAHGARQRLPAADQLRPQLRVQHGQHPRRLPGPSPSAPRGACSSRPTTPGATSTMKRSATVRPTGAISPRGSSRSVVTGRSPSRPPTSGCG